MKIAIHQPEHFPYMGFFRKMERADLFVLLDDVHYTKGNFQNRNRFKNTNGKDEWFTIILQKDANKHLIKDIKVNKELNWKTPILNKLKQNFKKDFSFIYDYDSLLDINLASINYCKNALNISTPIVLSSTLDINTTKSQRLSDICGFLKATEYISGIGGKNYLDESVFNCKITYYEPLIPDYYTTLQHI